MGGCNATNTLQSGIAPECDITAIGCVPQTNGLPIVTPEIDQLPIHIDTTTGCIWLYICDDVGWYSVCPGSNLCDLTPVDVSVLTDVCQELNIPVTYEIEGECVEGVVTLQNLADEISNCLPDNSADCCFEPYLEVGRVGDFTRSRCFSINGANNPNSRLIDTLTSQFDGLPNPGLPMDWSYTNTTNRPGILTITASMWVERYDPSGDNLASVLFLIGETSEVNSYSLDPNQVPVSQFTDTPYTNTEVSYVIRTLPNEATYPFWGSWIAICPACEMGKAVNTDMNHEFLLQPNETINISGRIAVGYERILSGSGLADTESGYLGTNMRYTFVGSNDISTT